MRSWSKFGRKSWQDNCFFVCYFSGMNSLSLAMEQKNAQEIGELNTTLECNWYFKNHFRYASSFGDCSEKCGPGKTSRRVFCIKVLLQKYLFNQIHDFTHLRMAVPLPQLSAPRTWSRWRSWIATTTAQFLKMEAGTMQLRWKKETKSPTLISIFMIQVATGEPDECEYYDDWWIFGEEGSGNEDPGEADPEFRRRRRQADGSGDASGDGDEAPDGGNANGTVADGEGGNSTKKEIDLSIFSKRCKPEKVHKGWCWSRFDCTVVGGAMWQHDLWLLSRWILCCRGPLQRRLYGVQDLWRHKVKDQHWTMETCITLCHYQGLVAVGTVSQWQQVWTLLVARPEFVRKLCLAAATTERLPHLLFLRPRDEDEGKQRSREMVRERDITVQSSWQYFQGDTEASASGDDGASEESEEDSDGSGDAAEEEGEDETKCEENKKCQNGKFGKWHIGFLWFNVTDTRLLSGRTHTLPRTKKARLLWVSWGGYFGVPKPQK